MQKLFTVSVDEVSSSQRADCCTKILFINPFSLWTNTRAANLACNSYYPVVVVPDSFHIIKLWHHYNVIGVLQCWSWTPLVLLVQKQQQRNNIKSSQSWSWWLVMYLLRPCGPICVTDKQHEPWSVSVSSGMGIKTFSTACGSCSRSISGETWAQTAPDSIQIFPNLRGFLKISSVSCRWTWVWLSDY